MVPNEKALWPLSHLASLQFDRIGGAGNMLMGPSLARQMEEVLLGDFGGGG